MASLRRSSRPSTARSEQVRQFLDAVMAAHVGILVLARGVGGHYNDNGSYRFRHGLHHQYFNWPNDRQRAIGWVLTHRTRDDIYLIPNLRRARNPKKEFGKAGRYVWVDIDVVTDETLDLLRPLLSEGSIVVQSGGRGGLHVYLRLDGWYPRRVFQKLNEQFAHYIGGDPKFTDNSLLRVPGTGNHKGRANGEGSYPVILRDGAYNVPPWSPEALSAVLGPLPAKAKSKGSRKSRTTGREAQRNPKRIVVPVTAEAVPPSLPDDVVRGMGWSKKKGEADRSGQLHSLVAVAMAHGYTDGQVMAIAQCGQPGQDKWPDPGDLSRAIQMSIEKLRPNHDHVGLSCQEAGCSTNSPRLIGQLMAIEDAFKSNYRPGRSLQADSKIMDAFFLRAEQVGDLELDMSVRHLAELAGVSRDTAAVGLKRLIKAGYLFRVCDEEAEAKAPGRRALPNQAYRYRLTCPSAELMTHNHSAAFLGFGGGRAFEMLDPRHEVWHSTGLHRARRTFEALVMGLSTIPQIADYQGLTLRTIKEHLKALSLYGMAEEKPDGKSWIAHGRPPDEVAEELGTLGKGRERNAHYTRESEAYTTWLTLRKEQRDREQREMEEQFTQELIDKGYLWVGPVLVSPASYERSQRAKAKKVTTQEESRPPRRRVRYVPIDMSREWA